MHKMSLNSDVYPFLSVPLTHTNISPNYPVKNEVIHTARGSNLDSRSLSLSLCSLWLFSSLLSREDLKEAASSANLDVGRYSRLLSSLDEDSSANDSRGDACAKCPPMHKWTNKPIHLIMLHSQCMLHSQSVFKGQGYKGPKPLFTVLGGSARLVCMTECPS